MDAITTATPPRRGPRPRARTMVRVTAAFAALGMSDGAGYDALKRGTLPFETFRVGGIYKVRRADLEAVLGQPFDNGHASA